MDNDSSGIAKLPGTLEVRMTRAREDVLEGVNVFVQSCLVLHFVTVGDCVTGLN